MGGGNSTKQQSVENKTPWSGQQPYLSKAFTEADQIYDKQKDQNQPGYQGEFLATPRKDMQDAFQHSLNFTNGMGISAANSAVRFGESALGSGLQSSNDATGGLFGLAKSDLAGGHIADASRYANNPQMDGMVDAAMRDGRRQVYEQALPGIDREAAATGNLNSSRTGIAQGLVERGLAEKTADVSANLRGQAYQQGLGLAQGNTNARMGALQAAGGLGSDMFKSGLGGLGQSADIANTNNNTSLMASSVLGGYDQSQIDNALAKRDYEQAKPWSNLQNYWGVVGDKSWGGTTTSSGTKTENPSGMSSVASGVGVLGSLLKFCDSRLKNIVAPAGHGPMGVPMYLFSYNQDPTHQLHRGPMAQDVRKVIPEAVIELDGTLLIDTSIYSWT